MGSIGININSNININIKYQIVRSHFGSSHFGLSFVASAQAPVGIVG